MPNANQGSDESPEKGVTRSYSDGADMRTSKNKNKWRSRTELETAEAIWDRFHIMENHMKSSCPFTYPVGFTTDDGQNTGTAVLSNNGSWFDYMDRCDIQWSMIRLTNDPEMLDLRSPMAFAPVEAAMADFQRGDILPLLEPKNDPDDAPKAKLIQAACEDLYYTKAAQIRLTDKETFHDTLKYGFAIRYVGWFDESRELDIIKDGDQLLKDLEDDKDGKKAKEIERLLDGGKPVTQKEIYRDHNDIAHVRVSPREFYADPDAKYMRHRMSGMNDCIWKQVYSVEAALAEFKHSRDPWVIKENVGKIVSAADAARAYNTDDTPFFMVPTDIESDTQVVVLRYYNRRTDKYIVMVNDVVLRDGPLPYNHKELPFTYHKLINWEDILQGVGLPAMVDALQSEDEDMRSLMVEQLKINIAPPLFYNQALNEDIETIERYQAGQMIPMGGPIDGSMMQWMPQSAPRFDYFNMQRDIMAQSTLVTGIDPLASSQPRPDEAVRTHLMSMESTQRIIGKHIDNWSDGREEAVWMDIRLMQQYYPVSYVKKLDDGGERPRYKVIKTRGKNFQIERESGSLVVNEEKAGYGFFEMKGEYLKLSSDLEIKLNLDQVMGDSRASQAQNARQLLSALTPLLQDPNIMQNPAIPEMIRWVGELHNVPKEVLDTLQDGSDEQDVELARQQNEDMSRGRVVSGRPGESYAHIVEHMTLLTALYEYRRELENKLQPEPMFTEEDEPTQAQIDRAAAKINELESKSEGMQRQLENIQDFIDRLAEHVERDRIPKFAQVDTLLKEARPSSPMAPQGPAPVMGGGLPPMAGAMQGGAPLPPEAAGMMQGQPPITPGAGAPPPMMG